MARNGCWTAKSVCATRVRRRQRRSPVDGSQWLPDRKKRLCYSCQKAAKAQPVTAATGFLATPVGQHGALGVESAAANPGRQEEMKHTADDTVSCHFVLSFHGLFETPAV
jgi:hypothetical protein